MKEVVAAYNDKSDVKQVQSSGLHIAGEKFVVLKCDDRSIYGKKVRLKDRERRSLFYMGMEDVGYNNADTAARDGKALSSSRPHKPSSLHTTPRLSSLAPLPTPSNNSATTSSRLATRLHSPYEA